MIKEQDIVIIGAGLAGLSAALQLEKAGKQVAIYEAQSTVGGKVSSEYLDGFTLDRGFQVLLTAYPECQALLDYAQLDLHPFQKGGWIWLKGKFVKLNLGNVLSEGIRALSSPIFSVKDLFNFPSLAIKLKSANEKQLLQASSVTALEKLQEEGFSQKMIDRFFRPFLGGVLLDRSLNCPSVLVDFVFKMFMEGDTSLPAKGMQAISNQLASKLKTTAIHLNTKVDAIDEMRVHFSNGQQVQAKKILLACDVWTACHLLRLPLPPKGRDVACCYFASEQAPVDMPVLVLNGDSDGPVNQLAVLNQIAPSYAPEGKFLISTTVLEDRYGVDMEMAIKDQLSSWFGPQVHSWQHLKTYYIENAHPSHYPLYVGNHFKIRDNVYVCGDYLESPSIQSALSIGRRAAEEILKRG